MHVAGIYVHFPYCDVKCAYCDFFSLEDKFRKPEFWIAYQKKIVADIEFQHSLFGKQVRPWSVFLGGGTPSKAPIWVIESVLKKIFSLYQIDPEQLEITCEANPESASLEFLQELKKIGVNRLSVGIQSRDAGTLRYLGRLYDAQAYENVLDDAIKAGFTNLNCDIIYGVPGQSLRSTVNDIAWALKKGVSHISAYSLVVEPGTILANEIKSGKKANVSQSRQQRMHEFIRDLLEKNGYCRYEISNYSRPGYQCRHNLIYWRGRPYLGIGVSAHGYNFTRRYAYPRSIDSYLHAKEPEASPTILSDIFTGALRITGRQNLRFYLRYATQREKQIVLQILEKYHKRGWLRLTRNHFEMLIPGLNFADTILFELYSTLVSDDGHGRRAHGHGPVLQA